MISRLRPVPAVAVTLLAASLLSACGEEETEPSSKSCSYPVAQEAAKDVDKPAETPDLAAELSATLTFEAGEATIALTPERTPCTVNSFVSLASQGWYDGTPCHRLTTAGIFVLQCGDPTGTGTGGPGYTIPDEVDGTETYPAGTVAMAKTREPDSGGSQFFLVYDESPLPPDYTVFATVDDAGLDVLREIAAAGVDGGASDGPPAQEVVIETVAVS